MPGAQELYERLYCYGGEIENRIKELLHGLELDRTSCSRFCASQVRVLLTAAAYVLLQELQRHAAHTFCARLQRADLIAVRAAAGSLALHGKTELPSRCWRASSRRELSRKELYRSPS